MWGRYGETTENYRKAIRMAKRHESYLGGRGSGKYEVSKNRRHRKKERRETVQRLEICAKEMMRRYET